MTKALYISSHISGRATRSSGYHACFVFGTSQAQTFNDIFVIIPSRSGKAVTAVIRFQLNYNRILPYMLQFTNHPEVLRACMNK
jgi:hypothetical protein